MVICPYCKFDIPEDGTDVEKCPEKPFTVILTRAEIWGLVDDYLTKKKVIKKLKKVIGRYED